MEYIKNYTIFINDVYKYACESTYIREAQYTKRRTTCLQKATPKNRKKKEPTPIKKKEEETYIFNKW